TAVGAQDRGQEVAFVLERLDALRDAFLESGRIVARLGSGMLGLTHVDPPSLTMRDSPRGCKDIVPGEEARHVALDDLQLSICAWLCTSCTPLVHRRPMFTRRRKLPSVRRRRLRSKDSPYRHVLSNAKPGLTPCKRFLENHSHEKKIDGVCRRRRLG